MDIHMFSNSNPKTIQSYSDLQITLLYLPNKIAEIAQGHYTQLPHDGHWELFVVSRVFNLETETETLMRSIWKTLKRLKKKTMTNLLTNN